MVNSISDAAIGKIKSNTHLKINNVLCDTDQWEDDICSAQMQTWRERGPSCPITFARRVNHDRLWLARAQDAVWHVSD